MTNYRPTAHAVAGPSATPMDAGAGATYGTFHMKVVAPQSDCVVALETSPDLSTWTQMCTVTGGGNWGFARSDHRQRAARSNVLNMGTGGTGINPPAAPTTATATTGGTVAAGTYLVATSYNTPNGETPMSPTTSQATTGATSTLTTTSPPASTPAGATGWNLYMSQPGGTTLTRQNSAPLNIGTNNVTTAPPTSTGAAPQSANGIAAIITSYP